MSTFQNQNQFAQTPVLGQVDMILGPANILPVRIDPASTATQAQLQSGSPMKLVDVTGTEIIVDAAAITDVILGVIIYNPRKNLYAAGDVTEIGAQGTIVYLETSAAVARGASVQAATATGLVATRTGAANASIGRMMDKPAAANVLARVLIGGTTANGTSGPLVSTAAAAPAAMTYVAPAGGATVDAEARASLAQLAVDVTAVRTALVNLRTAAVNAGIAS